MELPPLHRLSLGPPSAPTGMFAPLAAGDGRVYSGPMRNGKPHGSGILGAPTAASTAGSSARPPRAAAS